MVAVPREMLAEILNDAEGWLWSVHQEFCISTDKDADGNHACDLDQERIDLLRIMAGIVV
jgi:hypothetical protein